MRGAAAWGLCEQGFEEGDMIGASRVLGTCQRVVPTWAAWEPQHEDSTDLHGLRHMQF